MLYIDFGGEKTDNIGHPDVAFNYRYELDWFNDPIVKQIVKDIDGGQVIAPGVIQVEPYGIITPIQLSSTCRNTILAYEQDIPINATFCDSKASDWLLRLGTMKDLTICLDYVMMFNTDFKAIIVNDGRQVNSFKEYLVAASYFLYERNGGKL